MSVNTGDRSIGFAVRAVKCSISTVGQALRNARNVERCMVIGTKSRKGGLEFALSILRRGNADLETREHGTIGRRGKPLSLPEYAP